MKVVVITNIPAPYQVKFCKELQESKCMEFSYIFCEGTTDERPKYWQIDLSDNCIVLDESKKIEIGKGRYLNSDISKVLEKVEPDVIIAGGFGVLTNYMAYKWAKKNRRKFIIWTEISRKPKNLKIYKRLYSKLDGILACGIKAQRQYESVFTHIPVLNFSYPADLDNKLRINRTYEQDAICFLYASRFVEGFASVECLKAFKLLADKYTDIRLLMSSYGPLLKQCEEYVAEHKLEEKVEFRLTMNSWEDVNKLYEDSDVLLYPAAFAGWGLVIPEAMAAGMPVITADGVGAADLVDSEQIVDNSVEGIKDAMEMYLLNPQKLREVGMKNREKAKSLLYSCKVKELEDLIIKIVK